MTSANAYHDDIIAGAGSANCVQVNRAALIMSWYTTARGGG